MTTASRNYWSRVRLGWSLLWRANVPTWLLSFGYIALSLEFDAWIDCIAMPIAVFGIMPWALVRVLPVQRELTYWARVRHGWGVYWRLALPHFAFAFAWQVIVPGPQPLQLPLETSLAASIVAIFGTSPWAVDVVTRRLSASQTTVTISPYPVRLNQGFYAYLVQQAPNIFAGGVWGFLLLGSPPPAWLWDAIFPVVLLGSLPVSLLRLDLLKELPYWSRVGRGWSIYWRQQLPNFLVIAFWTRFTGQEGLPAQWTYWATVPVVLLVCQPWAIGVVERQVARAREARGSTIVLAAEGAEDATPDAGLPEGVNTTGSLSEGDGER